ncbi:MAG: transcriptional regulator [Azospira oryzae]|jgi:BlaI family penicillinase repressor|nr:transcriptional regulator [Cytophaga sp.]PZR40574.1 MAG: transcriptional regulator [Azospira oryzae]
MKAQTVKPTDKEMEILQILWKKSEVSVKEVHEELGGESANGYTTILKMMQIMHEKGLVTRQKNGKLHLYKAVTSPENTKTQLLDKMIHTVFQGSASQLVMSVLGNGKPSKQELKEIRNYLDQLEGGEK